MVSVLIKKNKDLNSLVEVPLSSLASISFNSLLLLLWAIWTRPVHPFDDHATFTSQWAP